MAKLFLLIILISLSAVISSPHNSFSQEAVKETNETQIKGLMAALYDTNPLVQAKAINELAELNYEPVLPQIVKFIKGDNLYTKAAATKAVGKMDKLSPEITALIVQNLSDPDKRIRYSSAMTLAEYGSLKNNQIPPVITLLSDEDYKTRLLAIIIIKNNVEASKKQIPQILQLMKDENPEVRSSAVRALGKMGPAGRKNINAIIALLKDKNPKVRSSAAFVIGDFGPSAAEHAADVVKLLNDPNKHVQASAINYLGKIGVLNKEQILLVISFLKSNNALAVDAAIVALGTWVRHSGQTQHQLHLGVLRPGTGVQSCFNISSTTLSISFSTFIC